MHYLRIALSYLINDRWFRTVIAVCSLVTLLTVCVGWTAGTRNISIPLMNEDFEFLRNSAVRVNFDNVLMRSTRWDCGITLLEEGKSIGRRVQSATSVTEAGGGRFWVSDFKNAAEGEYFYFSSSDGSSPTTNGRKYSLSIQLPRSRLVGIPAFSVGLALASLLFAAASLRRSDIAFCGTQLMSCRVPLLLSGMLLGCSAAASFTELTPLKGQIKLDGQRIEFRLPLWYRGMLTLGSVEVLRGSSNMTMIPACLLSESRLLAADEYTITRSTPPCVTCSAVGESELANMKMRFYLLPVKTFILLLLPIAWVWMLNLLSQETIAQKSLTALLALWTDVQNVKWSGYLLVLLVRFAFSPVSDPAAFKADYMNYASWSLSLFDSIPVHPIGVSLLACLARQLAIPWSVFVLSILWISTVYLTEALQFAVQYQFRVLLALLVLILPDYFTMLSLFGSEIALAIAVHWTLGAVIRLIAWDPTQHFVRTVIAMGAGLTLWTISRTELQLVLLTHLLISALIVFRGFRVDNLSGRSIYLLLLLPLLTCLTADRAVRLVMFQRQGMFATAALEGPGLMKLMGALYKIESPQRILYAPVTRETLKKACEHSRILDYYKSDLLDPLNGETRFGASIVGIEGEPGPHLNWLLPSVFWKLGPSDGDSCMLAAANELESAIISGKLKSRPATFPVDPNYSIWLHRLPSSIWSAFVQPFRQCWDSDTISASIPNDFQSTVFDLALGRKCMGSQNSRPVAFAEFSGATLERGSTLIVYDTHSDLIGSGSVLDSGRCEFILRPASLDGLEAIDVFVFHRVLGRCDQSHMLRFQKFGDESELVWKSVPHEAPEAITGSARFARATRPHSMQILDAAVLRGRLSLFGLLGIVTAIFCPVPVVGRVFWVCICCVSWWVSRALLIGLVDAMLNWGTTRYMGSMGGVAAISVFSCFYCIVSFLRRWLPWTPIKFSSQEN